MKKLLCIAMIVATLTGCTTKTQFGECIGITDKEKPEYVYKVSAWNIFLGVIFSETIVVPVVVAVDDLKCPVSLDPDYVPSVKNKDKAVPNEAAPAKKATEKPVEKEMPPTTSDGNK
jgi:hypothetical protein